MERNFFAGKVFLPEETVFVSVRQNRMKMSLFLAVVLFAVAGAKAESVFESSQTTTPQSAIDTLVFNQLQRLGIQPANPCSDAVFVRRVYLDAIGTLPTVTEVQDFLKDQSPNKRQVLIDRLLARNEFADYWAMKWSDVLRIRAEFPINLWPNAVQAYHRWVHTCIKDNVPYDQFVREMLITSGSNFRIAPVNFYRAMQDRSPEGIAYTVALTFMGERADKWPKEKLTGMAGFFARIAYKETLEWKEEIVYDNPGATNAWATGTAVFPDGKKVTLDPTRDPRLDFADWLISPKNPAFTRNIANRVWSWLVGRGIVHEPDDIRPNNPPANPELLAYLEKELIGAKYDLKHLYRLILNSRVYQLSSIPKTKTPQAEANFASYPLRRLEGEVLIDALNLITGTTESYSSAIPEPFTYIPEEQRSIALADGSITSSFLELFGRPARATGLESERSNLSSVNQRLHLLNSSHIQKKIEQSPKFQSLTKNKDKTTPRDIVTELYLRILSRYPTAEDFKAVSAYADSKNYIPRDALNDLIWALINSTEFLYRH